jgi:dienelactone hydrolase
VPAYLLVPKAALTRKARLPAVLVLHPTDQTHGYRSSIEQLSPRFRAYAHELAERGFVTLVPAYPLMADYQPDLKGLGYQSGTMKAIWNNKRGLDYLDSLPFVKHGNYGALGHSLGGHNALYTAAFEDRIAVVVSSCGFDSFLAYYDGKPENWQADRGWCQERYMPKLINYRGLLEDIPFDFHEILALLAPRRVFVNAPVRDSNFRWRSVDEIITAARPVYKLHGAGENLTVEHPDSEHDFPPEQRQQAYRLLETALRKGE